MELMCIATGSSGNCHVLKADSGEMLILDCGISLDKVLSGIGFDIGNVVGALVTHHHSDHSRAAEGLKSMGVEIFAPYLQGARKGQYGDFKVHAFELTDTNGEWCHTNGDGTPCPCYGFLVKHDEMGKMLYVTDTELCKYRFKGIDHMLVGTNYDLDCIKDDAKSYHVASGHMNIDTSIAFAKAQDEETLKTYIMCHLSKENAARDLFIKKAAAALPGVNVQVSKPGMEWKLRKERG